MPSKEPMPDRCGAKVNGGYCTQRRMTGINRCRSHPGMSLAKARTKGAIVTEIQRWGLGDTTVDPGEVMLRLVSQSAARVDMYSRLLAEAYEAAERLKAAEQAPQSDLLEAETARLDLERIFNTGGVSALIGHTYAGTQTSGVIATGEAIRGLAKLEGEERDRCANFSTKAIAAGLAERMTRLAEKQGAMLAGAITEILIAVGADPKDPEVAAKVRATLDRVMGAEPRVIEGKVA